MKVECSSEITSTTELSRMTSPTLPEPRRERRTIFAATAVGAALGALASSLATAPALLVPSSAFCVLGYAIRSYVSYRRRQRFLTERALRAWTP